MLDPAAATRGRAQKKRVNGLRVSGQEEAAEEVGQKMALTSCARCRASN